MATVSSLAAVGDVNGKDTNEINEIFGFQTLGGSFSSVWTAPIARVGAFFSIFRDLQDSHSFAPLQSQFFSKKAASKFWRMKNEISFAE